MKNYGYAHVLTHLNKIMQESCPKDYASSLSLTRFTMKQARPME